MLKGPKNVFFATGPPSPPPLSWRSGSATELYIIQCPSFWEMSNSFWRMPLIYKLSIYKVYLLRDAKLLMRDSVYKIYINTVYLLLRDAILLLRGSKLYINTVYLFLRDVKLFLRDSINSEVFHIQYIKCTSFWEMPNSSWGIPFTSYTLIRCTS